METINAVMAWVALIVLVPGFLVYQWFNEYVDCGDVSEWR
jgi:uncharacterized membrane protein YjjB (DUF3815 family)